MNIIKRKRILNIALGIHIAVAISSFTLPSSAMPMDQYFTIVFALVGLSSILAFVSTYKILKSSSVFIFCAGSIFPLMGVLLILLLRERLNERAKAYPEQNNLG